MFRTIAFNAIFESACKSQLSFYVTFGLGKRDFLKQKSHYSLSIHFLISVSQIAIILINVNGLMQKKSWM